MCSNQVPTTAMPHWIYTLTSIPPKVHTIKCRSQTAAEGMAYGGLPFPGKVCPLPDIGRNYRVWNNNTGLNSLLRNPLYQYIFPIRVLCGGLSGVVACCLCGVWGLITSALYVRNLCSGKYIHKKLVCEFRRVKMASRDVNVYSK